MNIKRAVVIMRKRRKSVHSSFMDTNIVADCSQYRNIHFQYNFESQYERINHQDKNKATVT